MANQTCKKRIIKHPERFEGKRIDPNKWILPPYWHLCRQTSRLYHENDLLVTFSSYRYERLWLRSVGIYADDADWLCEDGYEEILAILEKHNAVDRLYDWA